MAAIYSLKVYLGIGKKFDRLWELLAFGENSYKVRCDIKWDAGSGDFEPIVALRIRYGLIKLAEQVVKNLMSIAKE